MSEVRLLKPEEMGLTEKVQKFEDALRTEEKSGSYEWWYFDSKYPDGSSLVIVFYTIATWLIRTYLCLILRSISKIIFQNKKNPQGYMLCGFLLHS